MSIVSNLQSFNVSSGVMSASVSKFKTAMDSILIDGPDLTIDLQPEQTECPGNCRYNATYEKFMGAGSNNIVCRTCKGQGFLYEQRQTIYKCNRRWTNEPFDNSLRSDGQKTPGGMVYGNFVRTKTVVQSFNHIQQSLGATIDGVKVKLFQEPRQTGYGSTKLYVITWWERANKKASNG